MMAGRTLALLLHTGDREVVGAFPIFYLLPDSRWVFVSTAL